MKRTPFMLQTFRHGFPHQPTALAFDPVQRLLAIGTKSGSLRMYPLTLSLMRGHPVIKNVFPFSLWQRNLHVGTPVHWDARTWTESSVYLFISAIVSQDMHDYRKFGTFRYVSARARVYARTRVIKK